MLRGSDTPDAKHAVTPAINPAALDAGLYVKKKSKHRRIKGGEKVKKRIKRRQATTRKIHQLYLPARD